MERRMPNEDLNVMEKGLTLVQRQAICFAAGVIGGLAVVFFSYVLFELGLSAAFGVKAPISLNPPGIYKPLFWAGLWGIPFGHSIKFAWKRLYLVGLLYFLAPLLALYIIFLPMSGAGYFGLQQGGPTFAVSLLLLNLPYGDNHGFGRKGDHREKAVSILDERDRLLGIQIPGPRAGDLL
jgi:hypothetical protein